jgi:two-component system osmolarity sensor histidine kinase EnvZ
MNPLRKILHFIKSFLPRTLYWRSLLILVTPIFLVQIITTYIFFDRHWQKMGDRMAYAIAGEIAFIADKLERDDNAQNVAALEQALQNNLSLFLRYRKNEKLIRFYEDRQNGLNIARRENIIADTLARALDQKLSRPYDITVDRNEKWVAVSVQLQKGVVVVALPERRIFSSSGYVVLIWMAGSSLILLIIATLFMRNQIRPIRRLAVAAERIGKGRDVPYFKLEGAKEVRQAGQAFLEMRDRIQRQIQQRTTMLAGVSHDLRTPLTRMKLQLSMMGEGQDVSDLKKDIVDMERMIDAYLQFARGEGEEEAMRLDLKALMEEYIAGFNKEDLRVIYEIPDNLTLPLRPVAFRRCVMNLLENALKYGRSAWVTARRFENMIEIWIEDDGPGIPEAQYSDVFKPFFRGEASRNSKTGGVGLGLPIVQDIVLSHGGSIWLDKSPKGGLRVVIDLPV